MNFEGPEMKCEFLIASVTIKRICLVVCGYRRGKGGGSQRKGEGHGCIALSLAQYIRSVVQNNGLEKCGGTFLIRPFELRTLSNHNSFFCVNDLKAECQLAFHGYEFCKKLHGHFCAIST